MFTSDVEKTPECVDVSGLEDDTKHQLLLYMYANSLECLQWESALKLYPEALEYEIVGRRKKCVCCLFETLLESE
ncbi:hypothetical protein TNIN_16561 [Trichonephila inaurata madagascariensis]|uniref:Uncharacterized protein n=1 Tax=Trichonephila inaurata madagascariensis TaxID=2747483 RepID=A0A8X6WXZ0_9ARAC|nr:hypothetical protein TNIN_16561 [Trichonephila inaurata madagascariensis]